MGRPKKEQPTSTEFRKPPKNSYKAVIGDIYQCQICNRYIRGTLFNVSRHYRAFHSSTKKKYSCEVCKKLYSRKDNLSQHVRKIHEKEPTVFDRVVVRPPPVEPISTWNPPPEAVPKRPKFRITPGPSTITSTPPRATEAILREMTTMPNLLSPLADPGTHYYATRTKLCKPDNLKNTADVQENDTTAEMNYVDNENGTVTNSCSHETICLDERSGKLNFDIHIYSIYGIFQ